MMFLNINLVHSTEIWTVKTLKARISQICYLGDGSPKVLPHRCRIPRALPKCLASPQSLLTTAGGDLLRDHFECHSSPPWRGSFLSPGVDMFVEFCPHPLCLCPFLKAPRLGAGTPGTLLQSGGSRSPQCDLLEGRNTDLKYLYQSARWDGPENCPTHADVMRGPHSWRELGAAMPRVMAQGSLESSNR